MSSFHVTSHYLPGDKLTVFPRQSDFFPENVAPAKVKTVTVDKNGLADIGSVDDGPYWLKSDDGPALRVDVHAGNEDPAWLDARPPKPEPKHKAAPLPKEPRGGLRANVGEGPVSPADDAKADHADKGRPFTVVVADPYNAEEASSAADEAVQDPGDATDGGKPIDVKPAPADDAKHDHADQGEPFDPPKAKPARKAPAKKK